MKYISRSKPGTHKTGDKTTSATMKKYMAIVINTPKESETQKRLNEKLGKMWGLN